MGPERRLRERTPANGGIRAERLSPASFGTRSGSLLLTALLIVVTLVVGWLVWSVVEWCGGRTPSYRLTGLRVVRRADGKPVGLGRSVIRELCCAVLLLPTLAVCCVLAIVFVMGASPPDGLLRQSRRTPWDRLTGTDVVRDATGEARGLEGLSVLRLEESLSGRQN